MAIDVGLNKGFLEEDFGPVASGLTREEDDELRRLGYFARLGMLSDATQYRLLELRLRDRRTEIREPRDAFFTAEVETMIPESQRPQ